MHSLALRNNIYSTFLLSIIVIILAVALSGGLSQLRVRNLQTVVGAREAAQLLFAAQLLGVDTDAGTFTMDWYPSLRPSRLQNHFICPEPPFIADIFFDVNLLSDVRNSNSRVASNNVPSEPIFTFNSTAACNSTYRTASPTFRTVSKLVGDFTTRSPSSPQQYPFDRYISQVALFARDRLTDQSISLNINKTWGIVPNFQVDLVISGENDGALYIVYNISRSIAVQAFVMLTVIVNWGVTAVFLLITVASFLWPEAITKDLFVLPLAALFAFTSVRSNLPGSPAGFGADIDFYGILPNLVCITLCTFAMLLVVPIRRMMNFKGPDSGPPQSVMDPSGRGLDQVSHYLHCTGCGHISVTSKAHPADRDGAQVFVRSTHVRQVQYRHKNVGTFCG